MSYKANIMFLLIAGLGIFNIRFTTVQIKYQNEGEELIGKKAPEWDIKTWINSKPLYLKNLKGKVILLRWWTGTCLFCSRSASALNEFYSSFANKGLVVIGMFHPKPYPMETDIETIKNVAKKLKFEFPIAVDDDWKNLNKYWLGTGDRNYTSVSFLIDKKGVIRYIHPGPEYHKNGKDSHEQCRKDYLELKSMIEKLLID